MRQVNNKKLATDEDVPEGCCPLCFSAISHAEKLRLVPEFNAAHRGGQVLILTALEFDLVYVLYRNYSQPMSTEALVTKVYGGFTPRTRGNIARLMSYTQRKIRTIGLDIINIGYGTGSYVLRIKPWTAESEEKNISTL